MIVLVEFSYTSPSTYNFADWLAVTVGPLSVVLLVALIVCAIRER